MKAISLIILSFTSFVYSQYVQKPVIGVMSLPSEYGDEYPEDLWSTISATYVQFLQSAGAEVAPIQYDLPESNITYLLNNLNGVLFTGGGNPLLNPDGSLTPVGASLSYVVNYVYEQNQVGNYYPMWGTCMGFQTIAGFLQKNFSILTPDCVGCDGANKNNFFNVNYQSRLYSQLPDDLKEKMSSANLSAFFHHSMFHYDTFVNAVPLNMILTPTTYTYDDTGVQYVSSSEGSNMPIYATFGLWGTSYRANHSFDAIRLQQYLSNFFVNEARKNNNTFPDQRRYLIDNFRATNIGDDDTFFLVYLVYFFPSITLVDSVEPEVLKEFLSHYEYNAIN